MIYEKSNSFAPLYNVNMYMLFIQSMLYKKVKDAQARVQLSNELMIYHMQVDCSYFQHNNHDFLLFSDGLL